LPHDTLFACRKLFMKPRPLSPRQIQHRRKIHAQGRKHFVLYTGVLKFGGLMFICMILWEWHDYFSWRIPSATPGLFVGIVLIFLVSIATGYFWSTV
jgi:hypothetical protein